MINRRHTLIDADFKTVNLDGRIFVTINQKDMLVVNMILTNVCEYLRSSAVNKKK